MTLMSHVIQADSSYHGQALKAGEIRLLTIFWTTSDEYELRTQCHELNENLEFDAVSYVWGTEPASIPVKCNDATLYITPTAFEMLGYLYLFKPDPEYPIWVDAICIDQGDADEKAVQVPLMHRIYSKARRVVIWAGLSTSEIDVLMTELGSTAEPWHSEPAISDIEQRWPSDFGALGPFWTGLTQLCL
ncbi:hypothetical protein E8E12_005742 [Didymella heteroderae]|uniref:Heterokaryon incompatibility domain-containing protein n=1 Tax=Didymella heteroderae TaxID=1769908 RepID=A0A9P5C1S2_9PLEO|nr:hypothetical protein E8E12_005742 [Didymella heteroderae]